MSKEDAMLTLVDRTIGYLTLVIKVSIVAVTIFGVMYFIAYLQHKYRE